MGWLALVAGISAMALFYFLRLRRARPKSSFLPIAKDSSPAASITEPADNVVPFQSEELRNVTAATYTLAFGVTRFDYRIFAEHQQVIDAVGATYSRALYDPKYFPRRPAMLPKLLRALNDIESTRDEIVRLILQDPVLVGNVLRRANSAFYRQGAQPVESVERAFVVLGTEGLRTPVATAVMHPVFQLTRGFFDQFAPITWEQAQCAAHAAEELARSQRSADPFVAHLLGLLTGLSRIVLFRLVLDTYHSSYANVMPRAEVFIRVMLDNGLAVTRMIAVAWEMSEAFIAAIDAQIARQSPTLMQPLARTLYFANLCGELAVLHRHDRISEAEALAALVKQGLEERVAAAAWQAATTDISA